MSISLIRLNEWDCSDNISYELQHFFGDIDEINVKLLEETIKVNPYLDIFFDELRKRYHKLYRELTNKKYQGLIEIQDYNLELMIKFLDKYMYEGNILSGPKWKDLVIKEKQKEYMEQNPKGWFK